MRTRKDGHGGLLVTGSMLAMAMAAAGIAQGRFAGNVVGQTSRFTRGQLVELAADSALEEARIELARRLTDPTDTLYTTVHGIAASPGSPRGAMDLTFAPADLPQTQAMLGSPEMAGASIDAGSANASAAAKAKGIEQDATAAARSAAVQVKSGPLVVVPDSLGHAGELKLTFTGRVTMDRGPRVVRRVTRSIGLRFGPAVLPPPLSTQGLIVGDVESMARPVAPLGTDGQGAGVDINALVIDIAHRLLPAIAARHGYLMKCLASEAGRLSVVADVLRIHDRVTNDISLGGAGINHLDAALSTARSLSIPPFPDLSQGALLVAAGPTVHLATLDIQGRVRPLAERLTRARVLLEAARVQILNERVAHAQLADGLAVHRAYVVALIDVLDTSRAILEAVAVFQKNTTILTPATPGNDLLNFSEAVAETGPWDPSQMDNPDNALLRSATWRITQDPQDRPDRRSITSKFNEWLDRREKAETLADGMLFVDNPDEPLVLRRRLRGRLVIALTGGLVADGKGDPVGARGDSDFLTLVARGGACDDPARSASIHVRGEVRASLVLRGLHARIDPDAKIAGTLFLMGDGSLIPGRIAGTVGPDARIKGLEPDQLYFATLAPYYSTREVTRL